MDEVGRRLSFFAYHLVMPLFVLGRWDVLYTVWGGRPSEAIIPVNFSTLVIGSCWALGRVFFLLGMAFERYVAVSGNHFWPMFFAVALAAVSAHHYTVDTFMRRSRTGS